MSFSRGQHFADSKRCNHGYIFENASMSPTAHSGTIEWMPSQVLLSTRSSRYGSLVDLIELDAQSDLKPTFRCIVFSQEVGESCGPRQSQGRHEGERGGRSPRAAGGAEEARNSRRVGSPGHGHLGEDQGAGRSSTRSRTSTGRPAASSEDHADVESLHRSSHEAVHGPDIRTKQQRPRRSRGNMQSWRGYSCKGGLATPGQSSRFAATGENSMGTTNLRSGE
ncbi:unnamed protein product [Phytophthora fragariaefolia]|uniref:Unnamed protein product n=1 Tax=Phytophthora fragariaefolia TaxID=1490495 RepID=A0A9W6XP91_9STRA|nr:unnamed protein product [Phytophthora fragariaefolia]